MQGNNALRDHAIPFIAEPPRVYSAANYNIDALRSPQNVTSISNTVAIPILTPVKAQIVEAYLFMQMIAPTDMGLNVRIGIGEFTEYAGEPIIYPVKEYDPVYLNTQHRKITGKDVPFTCAANQTLTIDADLVRALYQPDDPKFNPDAFCLLVTFDSLPSTLNGYELEKFKVTASAQIGLGT